MKRALLFLALASCGEDDLAWDKAQIRELMSKAAAAEDKRDFDGAIGLYQKAMALAEKHEELQAQRASLRQTIEETRRTKEAHAKAKAELASLQTDSEKHAYPATRECVLEFLQRARRVQSTCESLELSIQDITGILDALKEELKKLPEPPPDVLSAYRKRIVEEFLKKGREDFPGAIEAWRKAIEQTKNPDVRRRAPGEIEQLHLLANEAWRDLRFRAIELRDPKEAAAFLRGHVARFRGCTFKNTDLEQEILAHIQELEP